MIGYNNKIKANEGKRDELIKLIMQGSEGMPGCLSQIVSADNENTDDMWVTEVWENAEAHQASLSIPEVKQAIETAMPLIASFERVATTTPSIIKGGTL